jgi:hypothetical protein
VQLESTFRLSTCLTLMLATFCLGYAEEGLLPHMTLVALGVCAAIPTAFAAERRLRWTPRSVKGADNVLGLLVVGGAAVAVFHKLRQPGDNPFETGPPPSALIPYAGPVLMALLLIKALLPKRGKDYWYLHGIGFLQVTLASVLGVEPLLGVLLFAYLACGVWSLILFHLRREQHRESSQSAGGPSRAPAPPARPTPRRLFGWQKAARWALAFAAGGLALFLLIPARGGVVRGFSSVPGGRGGPSSVGFMEGIDLNGSGEIEVSDQEALEFAAEDAGANPKPDLGMDVLLRGGTLTWYEDGRWYRYPFMGGVVPASYEKARQPLDPLTPLADPGGDGFFLTFTVDPRHTDGLLPLAEPVARPPADQPSRAVAPLAEGAGGVTLALEKDDTLSSLPVVRRQTYRYKQAVAFPDREGLRPAVLFDRAHENLTVQPLGGVRKWTEKLVQQLVKQKALTDEDLKLDGTGHLQPDSQVKVARALRKYLASSPEFSYTLNRRRQDLKLDPVEDFLFNVKDGHCELYASSLALMLRSVRIPARVVVGYRGIEGRGDGRYITRKSNRHTWVEAVVARRGPDGKVGLYWLTLDPTSFQLTTGVHVTAWDIWWREVRLSSRSLWRDFVLEYDADQQAELASILWARLTGGDLVGGGLEGEPLTGGRRAWLWPAAVAGVLLALLLGLRLAWRRRARRAAASPVPAVAFYARLLEALAHHLGLQPRPAQTPREFAGSAAAVLAAAPATSRLAATPGVLAGLFYRVGYGCHPLTEAEHREVAQRLGDLEAALAGRA